MPKPIRIQKYLSDNGVLSRRKTEEYIQAGRITVNGHRAEPGHPVTPRDVIAIDGQRVTVQTKKEPIYIMLNKPRGYVTTTSDELGRRCVTQLVEEVEGRVYPVGRLDKDSEGLLLMTNDGQFANLIMHPSHHITKTYRVTVRPGITEDQCVALSAGVDIGTPDKPEPTAPATVLVLEKYPDRAVVQITITQGKNRQVRRMCEAVGLTVARLKRTAIGPLRLGMLPPGQWRELKKSELIALRGASGGTPAPVEAPQPAKKPAAKKSAAPQKSAPRKSSDGITRDRSGALRFRPEEERPRRGAAGRPGKDRPAHSAKDHPVRSGEDRRVSAAKNRSGRPSKGTQGGGKPRKGGPRP